MEFIKLSMHNRHRKCRNIDTMYMGNWYWGIAYLLKK